jgi:hypothetical protein
VASRCCCGPRAGPSITAAVPEPVPPPAARSPSTRSSSAVDPLLEQRGAALGSSVGSLDIAMGVGALDIAMSSSLPSPAAAAPLQAGDVRGPQRCGAEAGPAAKHSAELASQMLTSGAGGRGEDGASCADAAACMDSWYAHVAWTTGSCKIAPWSSELGCTDRDGAGKRCVARV